MFFYFPSKTDVHVYYVYLQTLQYTYCDLEQTVYRVSQHCIKSQSTGSPIVRWVVLCSIVYNLK